MTYPEDMTVRCVHSQGDIRWDNHQIYLSETLAGEPVGLKQTDNNRWEIYYGPIKLAVLDSAVNRLIHLPRTPKQKDRKPNNIDDTSKKVLPMSPV